jgi:hypothetical protein
LGLFWGFARCFIARIQTQKCKRKTQTAQARFCLNCADFEEIAGIPVCGKNPDRELHTAHFKVKANSDYDIKNLTLI